MRSIPFVFFLGCFATAQGVECQRPNPDRFGEVTGVISAFQYDHAANGEWKSAVSIQARLLFATAFHLGVTYHAAPIEVWPPRVDHADSERIGARETLDMVTLDVGMQFPAGNWVPFCGIGRGAAFTDNGSRDTWVGYVGSKIPMTSSFSAVFRYRVSRVDWYEGRHGLNHDLGAGIAWAIR